MVNGAFRNFANFSNLLPGPLGGCNVNVLNGFGNDMGVLELDGKLNDFNFMQGQYTFVIGGQELWIDNVQTDP